MFVVGIVVANIVVDMVYTGPYSKTMVPYGTATQDETVAHDETEAQPETATQDETEVHPETEAQPGTMLFLLSIY